MVSWVAMDRIVEQQRATDAAYRKLATGKVLRSDAKPLTDTELLVKLRFFGIELDRPSLEQLCRQSLGGGNCPAPAPPAYLPRPARADGERLDLGQPFGPMGALVSGPAVFRDVG